MIVIKFIRLKLVFLALFFTSSVYSTNYYLFRTSGDGEKPENRAIICRYLKQAGTVKWQDETGSIHSVYGQEFSQLNTEIQSQKNAIQSFDCRNPKKSGNVLSIILASTGQTKNGKIKGFYANLRVKLKESGEFKFKVSSRDSDNYKVATFCSATFNNNGDTENYKKSNPTKITLQTHELIPAQCGHTIKLDSRHTGNCLGKEGHTECRALRELLSLPQNTFVDILPKRYQHKILFNEIHFISYWDACSMISNEIIGCSVKLHKTINLLRGNFNGDNLILFFHFQNYWKEAIYSTRVEGSIVDFKHDFKKFYNMHGRNVPEDILSNTKFESNIILNSTLNFYIGI